MEINSYADYISEYKKSIESPEKFWEEKAEKFLWKKKWDKVLEWNFNTPEIKWFVNAKLNITENCLDRHLKERGNKIAFHWEPNDPSEEKRAISYQELYNEVCRFANVLKKNGIQKGDRVCIYLPMIPQLVIAMLACARIGAVHSVVFAGFSSGALSNRINDAKAAVLITCDGYSRGNKQIAVKPITDEALKNNPSVKKVILVKRTNQKIALNTNEVWWDDEMATVPPECRAEEMDAEDMLFILYTSGSTGKPKGIVHTSAGYMVYVDYTFRNVFGFGAEDVHWCTADIGWITGHSYVVYAPLLSGITSVMYEGIPTYPDAGRWWEIIDKYKVNTFYTSPTAIRTLQELGTDAIKKHSLEYLKVLGTVGEPINESAWNWYYKNIGNEKCPIVDTWWQTETGGIAISPMAKVEGMLPGYAMYPMPGIQLAIVNDKGEELIEKEVQGDLCIKFPWPGMLRTIYGDQSRCKKTYFSKYSGMYFTEDGCIRDKNGYYRISGRVDDVIKVSGHLLGTAEIENAINQHPGVVESAVVGYPHAIKGNAIQAFVVLYQNPDQSDELSREIIKLVSKLIGPIAKPEKIQFVKALPKTRSGKIMRRILKKIAAGETKDFGDTSTLIEPNVIKEIIAHLEMA